jgi:hypothetical protein
MKYELEWNLKTRYFLSNFDFFSCFLEHIPEKICSVEFINPRSSVRPVFFGHFST